MSADSDRPTRKPSTPTDSTSLDRRVFALTILWHADTRRVGETALLEGLSAGRPIPVSRVSPLFSAPEAGPPRPLDDDVLSRTSPSLELALGTRERIELRPGRTQFLTEVDGVAISRPTPIGPAEVDAGVVLLVEKQVALVLHRMSLSFKRAPRGDEELRGASDAIEKVRADVKRVADLDLPVLLRGETGTGKELVARAIVAASRRADKPFVKVNLGGFPAGTAYGDLFGHERGAFTGAVVARKGHFLEANGGTLFLDEVGKTLPEVQANLLRALDDGEILPLGSSRPRRVDVRVIAATDSDLEGAVAGGKFDRGLLVRLAGYQIDLPPLRRRREDFGTLLLHFLKGMLANTGELNRLDPPSGDEKPWLSAAKVAKLASGRWPGNVRALRNAAHQIVVSSRGEPRARLDRRVEQLMEKDDRAVLAGPDGEPREAFTSSMALHQRGREISNEELHRVYHETGRSVAATAAALGLPRATASDMIDRNPLIKRGSEKSDEEVSRLMHDCSGDLTKVAEVMGISIQALKLRLARLRRNRSRSA